MARPERSGTDASESNQGFIVMVDSVGALQNWEKALHKNTIYTILFHPPEMEVHCTFIIGAENVGRRSRYAVF